MSRDKQPWANRRPFQPVPVKSVCDSWPLLQRLAIHQTTTLHWTLEDDVRNYHELGIGAVGAWRFKVDDYPIFEARQWFDEYGLTVSSLSWTGGFAFHDPDAHQAALHDGLMAVQAAADLGASTLLVLPGNRGAYTANHARKLIIDSIRQLADAAAEHGIQIALQPMDRRFGGDGFFLDSLDKYLHLLQDCRHPNVGLNLDVFHLRETPYLSRLDELVPWLRLVHLSDCAVPHSEFDRCALGTGTLPLDQIIEGLEAAGYRGFYEVALMSPKIWNRNPQSVLREIKSGFEAIINCPKPAV